MRACIHYTVVVLASTEMIQKYPESRFLCIGTGTASAIVVTLSRLDVGAQSDTVTTENTTIDTLIGSLPSSY